MSVTKGFKRISGVSETDAHLNRARLLAVSKHAPVIYFIVIVGSVAVSFTHFDFAPRLLTLGVPALLITLAVLRTIRLALSKVNELSDQEVSLRLRIAFLFTNFFVFSYTAWCISLYNYGDVLTQTQIIYFTGVTTFGCAACLMHQRSLALSIIFWTTVPFAIFLPIVGGTVHLAIVVNMVLVAIAATFVLSSFSANFADLIAHQRALNEKQAETQRLSDANLRLANMDSLTNLPNRRSYFSKLERLLQSALTYNTGLVVGVLDLDGFKPINDIYGHPTGDRLLVCVGERLAEMVENNVFVARLGGDEFGLIIEGDYTDAELLTLGQGICDIIKTPFDMDGIIAQMSASIGFAKLNDTADGKEQLFEQADYALYHAKQSAVGCTVLFSEEHQAQIREVSGIERHLRDADFEQEMFVVFQPIVNIKTGRATGCEALARWRSPILGQVMPSAFIGAAERAGLINKLSEVLLTKALVEAKTWPEDVNLSFNLSPHDISSHECILRLISIVEKSGFSPQRLSFEITESAVMQDFDKARDVLNLFKSMGICIALDDFGTGYSSLSYVRKLPLDRLKVDRSFITEIENDEMARSIVRTVVDLCRNLELECVVEGVETEGQAAILEDMGCTRNQGYLFSRPMDGVTACAYLRDGVQERATA